MLSYVSHNKSFVLYHTGKDSEFWFTSPVYYLSSCAIIRWTVMSYRPFHIKVIIGSIRWGKNFNTLILLGQKSNVIIIIIIFLLSFDLGYYLSLSHLFMQSWNRWGKNLNSHFLLGHKKSYYFYLVYNR